MKNHPVDTSRRERERERDVGWFDVGKVFCVRRRRLSEPEWARVRFKLRSNAKPALGRKQQIRCNEITSQLARLIRSPATRRNLLNLTVNRFFLPPPPPSPEKTLERNSATGRLPTNERKKDKAKTFARFFSSRLKLVYSSLRIEQRPHITSTRGSISCYRL